MSFAVKVPYETINYRIPGFKDRQCVVNSRRHLCFISLYESFRYSSHHRRGQIHELMTMRRRKKGEHIDFHNGEEDKSIAKLIE